MKRQFLLIAMLLTLCMGASAQQKVRKNFTVGDANFNVAYWQVDLLAMSKPSFTDDSYNRKHTYASFADAIAQ